MNILIPLAIVVLQLTCALQLCAQEAPTLTKREAVEIRQRLEEFDRGQLTLEQVTETGGEETGWRIVTYYLTHTNQVTVKMKLAVSRCYALFGKFPDAAILAKEYLNVYTNDSRGWDILGGAEMMMASNSESLTALTNAVRLGSERNLVGLGAAALKTERIDVIESMVVPRLLVLKDAKETTKKKRLEMLNILVLYSLKAKKEDVFISAIKGLDVADIASDSNGLLLLENIEMGCKQFTSSAAQELCRKIVREDRTKN